MNTTESVFGAPASKDVETVLDSKRGRGRPPKKTTVELEVNGDTAIHGTIDDVLGKLTSTEPTSYSATKEFNSNVSVSTEYMLAHAGQPADLVKLVNMQLKLGWRVSGSLVITPMGLFVQPLVKN